MAAPERRLALLDRDGTLIADKVYLADPDGIDFLPGAIAGLRLLRDSGFRLVLVTNQSGIARGYFDEETLARIHDRLGRLLAAEGIALDAIFYCPHGPDDGCACRKPAPGMLLAALARFGVTPDEAVMIGDSPADMGAAAAAGIGAIRIRADGAEGAARTFLAAAEHALALFGISAPAGGKG